MKKPKAGKKQKPLRGGALARAAVNQILLHPKTWDQSWWHSECGTRHCFGGWCQILAGYPANSDTAWDDAKEALGRDVGCLFDGDITLVQLHTLVSEFGKKKRKDLKPFHHE